MSGKDYTREVSENRGLLEKIMGYIPATAGTKKRRCEEKVTGL